MGEITSLVAAMFWACTTVAMRSESGRVPALALNALRSGSASLVALTALVVSGQAGLLASVPLQALGSLLVSILVGMALGDSLNIRAAHAIGVGRAMPIAGSYPIVTALLAVVVLGEPMTPRLALGILVVVAGVALVAYPRGVRPVPQPSKGDSVEPVGARVGVLMALGAALCWATSTVLVKPALDHVTPLVANAIRLPFACIVLFVLASVAGRHTRPFAIKRRSLAVLAATGAVSGFSTILWLVGVQLAGAAKAATLNSTAPVFAAPLAALVLGERLTAQVGIGIALTVLGVWLVI